MQKFLIATLLFVQTAWMSGQETLGFFDQINISGKVLVTLSHGDENSIKVDDHSKGEVNVEIDHGVLKVSRKELWNPTSYEEIVEVHIVYINAREINGSAGAIVEHEGEVKSGDQKFHFDTGASGTFTLRAERVEAQAGEGGIIRLLGNTETLEAKAVTGGRVKAGELEALRVFVRANTGGFADVYAKEQIDANATIGGNINYHGSPEKVSVKTSIGGTINAM